MRHTFLLASSTVVVLLLLVVATSSVATSSANTPTQKTEAQLEPEEESSSSSFSVEVPLDLPPLPQQVMQWSVDDVERWMNITIGYPEYSAVVRQHLIDGPTLLLVKVDDAFGPFPHAAHGAKLKAHQQILRGQCICPDNGKNSQLPSQTLWRYFDYSTRSSLFHLTFSVFAPRLAFASAYFFDRPMLCCALGNSGTGSGRQQRNNNKQQGDADIAAQLAQVHAGRTSSKSADELSMDDGPDTAGMMTTAAANNNNNGAEELCGASSETCAAAVSWVLAIFSLLVPYSVMTVYALPTWSTHPIFGSVWIVALALMQVSEVFYILDYVMLWREQGTPEKAVDTLKRAVTSFMSPLFLLVPASFVVGWFLPVWAAYLTVVGVTCLNGVFVVRMALNILAEFLGGPRGGPAGEQPEQQQGGAEQQQQDHHGSGNANVD